MRLRFWRRMVRLTFALWAFAYARALRAEPVRLAVATTGEEPPCAP